jgi:hypothetical protein
MDLIQALSSQAGLDTDRAQALAGGVLGLVRSAVETQSGPEAAQQVDAAVPELGTWQAAAARLVGDGESGAGGLGALGGLAAQALGGGGGAGSAGGGLGALGGLAAQALGGGASGGAGGGLGALGGLAAQALGGGASGAGLGGLAAQALAGGGLTSLFGKLGLDPSLLGTVAPLVLQFLEGRLPPELLGLVKGALPLLGGAGGSTGAGGVGGLLGGLIGRS